MTVESRRRQKKAGVAQIGRSIINVGDRLGCEEVRKPYDNASST